MVLQELQGAQDTANKIIILFVPAKLAYGDLCYFFSSAFLITSTMKLSLWASVPFVLAYT